VAAIAPDQQEYLTLPERLRQSQQDVDDADRALAHRREHRRRLVVQVLDEGVMTQRQVAKALGRGTGLVHKILTKGDPEDS
jgi:DNA-directed RNA polymerase specialized sigma24 family protein